MSPQSVAPDRASTLSFWLLVVFLAVLWAAGGASRADVLGQAVVRFFAWSILLVAILALPGANWRAVKEPALILGATALLIALQLVPLPPSIWTELPGREIFTEAAMLSGNPQPWRPLSISPSGTSNALASLIVPAVVLLLSSYLTQEQHWRIAMLVLGLVGAGVILGIIQFSGAYIANPFINIVTTAVSGNFANRNHFALFLAIGCVLALARALRSAHGHLGLAVAFGLLVVFLLTLLATGSRSGVVVGMLGIVLVGFSVWRQISKRPRTVSRRIAGLLAFAGFSVFAFLIWISISLERAASIDRATTLQGAVDLRWEIWPVVVELIENYFPTGTGFGTFDPVFRIAEPHALLQPQYINLAHNDWLQIVLEGGVLGFVLLSTAIIWVGFRGFRLWRSDSRQASSQKLLAKIGFITIIMILVASGSDYPARTPLMMALLAVATMWLASADVKSAKAR